MLTDIVNQLEHLLTQRKFIVSLLPMMSGADNRGGIGAVPDGDAGASYPAYDVESVVET